jgi:hypothetical protein
MMSPEFRGSIRLLWGPAVPGTDASSGPAREGEGTSISSAERSLTIHWLGGHTAFVPHQQGAPDDTATAFGFEPSYGNNFTLRHGESKDSGALRAGNYTVTEILPLGGNWTLDYIEIIDLDLSTPSTFTDETIEITLAPGETVRVIFHNVPTSQS